MNITLNGKIKAIGNEETKGDNFKVRLFVLETSETNEQTGQVYNNYFQIQTINDRTKSLDYVKVDDEVTVNCNLQGRTYTKGNQRNYFMSLNAWRIEKSVAPQQYPQAQPQQIRDPFNKIQPQQTNDLPF